MKKNKLGITMIALMFTILIVIILASTVTISASNIIKTTKKKEFAKEIYTIQRKVDEYNFKNSKLPIGDSILFDISNVKDKEGFSLEPSYSSGKVTLYKINYYEADIENLNRGLNKEENDIYVVSKDTKKVYYLKGIKFDDKYYYTLDDTLKNSLDI